MSAVLTPEAIAKLPSAVRKQYQATQDMIRASAGTAAPAAANDPAATPAEPASPAAVVVHPPAPALDSTPADPPPPLATEGQSTTTDTSGTHPTWEQLEEVKALAEKYLHQWKTQDGMISAGNKREKALQDRVSQLETEVATLRQAPPAAAPAPAAAGNVDYFAQDPADDKEADDILTPQVRMMLNRVVARAVQAAAAPVAERVNKVETTVTQNQVATAKQSEERFSARLASEIPYLTELTNNPLWAAFANSDPGTGESRIATIQRLYGQGTRAQSDEDRARIAGNIKRITDELHRQVTPPSRPAATNATPSAPASSVPAPNGKKFALSTVLKARNDWVRKRINAGQLEAVEVEYKKAREAGLVDVSA